MTEDLGEINDIRFQDMSAADIQLLMVYLGRVLDGFDAADQQASEKFPGSTNQMDRTTKNSLRPYDQQKRGRKPDMFKKRLYIAPALDTLLRPEQISDHSCYDRK